MSNNLSGTRPSRRRFVDWFLGTGVGGLIVSMLYPTIRYIVPPNVPESTTRAVTLPFSAGDIAPNAGMIFKFGKEPGILIRTPSGELRGFTAICTHLSCTVQYRSDLEHIWCACHNGHYDLKGINIAGPPPRPLEQYNVTVHGDQITVAKRG